MKIFTAKQIHDDPTPIYQAALQGPVKITHKYHGDFVMMQLDSDTYTVVTISSRGDEEHFILGDDES